MPTLYQNIHIYMYIDTNIHIYIILYAYIYLYTRILSRASRGLDSFPASSVQIHSFTTTSSEVLWMWVGSWPWLLFGGWGGVGSWVTAITIGRKVCNDRGSGYSQRNCVHYFGLSFCGRLDLHCHSDMYAHIHACMHRKRKMHRTWSLLHSVVGSVSTLFAVIDRLPAPIRAPLEHWVLLCVQGAPRNAPMPI